MRSKYIEAKTFNDFCKNQNRLIEILNHRMTQLEKDISRIKVDVAWQKKLLWAIVALLFSIAVNSL